MAITIINRESIVHKHLHNGTYCTLVIYVYFSSPARNNWNNISSTWRGTRVCGWFAFPSSFHDDDDGVYGGRTHFKTKMVAFMKHYFLESGICSSSNSSTHVVFLSFVPWKIWWQHYPKLKKYCGENYFFLIRALRKWLKILRMFSCSTRV